MDTQTELQYRIQIGKLSRDYERFTRNSVYLDKLLTDESEYERDCRIRTSIGIKSLKEYYKMLPPSRRSQICGGCGRIQTNLCAVLEQTPQESLGCYRIRLM